MDFKCDLKLLAKPRVTFRREFDIVQAKNDNGWNTRTVDEFNVIGTIAVIHIETGSDAPPPPTEVEQDTE